MKNNLLFKKKQISGKYLLIYFSIIFSTDDEFKHNIIENKGTKNKSSNLRYLTCNLTKETTFLKGGH